MMQKNANPTREQKEVLKKNGLRAWEWVVLQDLRHTMIIKHRVTGDVKHINKEEETKHEWKVRNCPL